MYKDKLKSMFKDFTRKPKMVTILGWNNLYLYNGETSLCDLEANLISPCIPERCTSYSSRKIKYTVGGYNE